METNERKSRRQHAREGKAWWWVVAVVVAVLIGVGAFYLFNSGDADEASTGDDGGGVVELPQNPSLRLFEEDGTWYVENDGNVTMSEIEVLDGSGTVICDLGVLSPDDRAACEEAGSGDGLIAKGSGPQGQNVEVAPPG